MLYMCCVNVLYEIFVSTTGIHVPLFLTLTFSFLLKKERIFDLFEFFGMLEKLIFVSSIQIFVPPFLTVTLRLVLFQIHISASPNSPVFPLNIVILFCS